MNTYLRPFVSDINSLMENLIRNSYSNDDTRVTTGSWIPAVDFKEDEDQFILIADLPGTDPKNIDISMENNILTIKGSRDEIRKEDKDFYHRTERIKGEFNRRFTLPDTADAENIKAKTKNGVLEIIIPKKPLAKSRKIDIDLDE